MKLPLPPAGPPPSPAPFAAMYVFIKVTRFAGYRSAPLPVPTPNPPVLAAAYGAGSEPVLPDGPGEYERHYEL